MIPTFYYFHLFFFQTIPFFPQQERFQVKNPPHTYLQKLRGYLDPAVTRKVSAPSDRLSCSIARWVHCCGFSVPLWTRVSRPGFPSSWGNIAHEAHREGLGTVGVRWRVEWKRRQLFMWNMWSWAESLNPSICMIYTHLIKFSLRWTRNPWVYQNDLSCVLASLGRCVHVLLEIAARLKQACWCYQLNQTLLLNVFFKQSLLFISMSQIYLVLA